MIRLECLQIISLSSVLIFDIGYFSSLRISDIKITNNGTLFYRYLIIKNNRILHINIRFWFYFEIATFRIYIKFGFFFFFAKLSSFKSS